MNLLKEMEINQITNLPLKENIHKLLEMCGSPTKEGIYKLHITSDHCISYLSLFILSLLTNFHDKSA